LLIAAAIFEVIWATSLKYLDGFNKILPLVINIVSMFLIVITLQIALRGLPLGVGYAAWEGLAAIGVVLVALICFGEQLNTWSIGCLILIISGVVGIAINATH